MQPKNPHILDIAQFAQARNQFDAIIDVRSPAEFALDHIPGSINYPVLNNEERAQIGTLYKQVSPFAAKKLGAAIVSRNIAQHLMECATCDVSFRKLFFIGELMLSLIHISEPTRPY